MANRQSTDTSSWLSKSSSPLDVGFHVHGVPFTLDRELLAARSTKVAALLKENSHEDLSCVLQEISVGPETFELVARFCHGYEVHLSTENVVPVACVANYLGMTESHSTNNLLKKALTFFEQRVLPSWNETIKALCTMENILQQAVHFGLVDSCLESIIRKALVDPRLLGEPINSSSFDDNSTEDDEDRYRYKPNARRRLFVPDCQSEDLTTLSLRLYEPIIYAMNQHGVPPEYVAASLCEYAKRWVFSSITVGDSISIYERNSQREVIEAVERILPQERGLLPCTSLFEMLRFAIVLEASSDCRNKFEIRIGKQLEHATVKDLLIPSQGYAKEVQYDIECVRRILKNFYGNYNSQEILGLIAVAELIEEFLGEVAHDIDLKTSTFILLAETTITASLGTQRNSDGIYRAIDIYLHKHRYLTQSEREEVCQVLDCQKMSPEACEHAAQNDQLPLRVVVQVLFVGQLQLRDTISKEVPPVVDGLRKEEEIEKMSNKVMELEKECYMMRKEIDSGCSSHTVKKQKVSKWKEMKRKFGCISSIKDCNCQGKKKKMHSK